MMANKTEWHYNADKIVGRLYEYIKRLDKSLQYSDERLKVIEGMKNDPVLIDYISSDGFRKKQIKNKNNFLSETDPISKLLDQITYYILFPEYRNKEHEEEFKKDETGLVLNNYLENNVPFDDYSSGKNKKIHRYSIISKSKFQKDKTRELLMIDLIRKTNKENPDYNEAEEITRFLEEHTGKKVDPKVKYQFYNQVTKDDLKKYPELMDIHKQKEHLKVKLGYGKSEKIKQNLTEKINTEFEHKMSYIPIWNEKLDQVTDEINPVDKKIKELEFQKAIYLSNNKHLSDMEINQYLDEINIEIQKLKLTPASELNVIFNTPQKDFLPVERTITRKKFDIDTVNLRQGWNFYKYLKVMEKVYRELHDELIQVKDRLIRPIRFKKILKGSGVYDYDYSYFVFSDIEQVKCLLKEYHELSEKHYDKKDDVWATLFDFNDLISKTHFTKFEQFILEEVLSGEQIKEIHRRFNIEFNKKWNELKVRRFIDEYIPNKIINTYLELRDEYLFYKHYDLLQPKYKKCPKCNEVKLALKRYYSPDKNRSDGFMVYCKICEKSRKK
jgi:hypothetical protein